MRWFILFFPNYVIARGNYRNRKYDSMKKNKKKIIDTNRIQMSVSDDEIQEYHKKSRKRMRKLPLPIILLLIWVGLYCCSLILGVHIYLPGTGLESTDRASYFLQDITSAIERTYNLIFGAGDTGNIEMFYCQFLAVALAGAALAACGTAFQGTFKNVLAGPSTMGVMSGGSLGCMIYLLFFYEITAVSSSPLAYFYDNFLQPICVLAGCFGGVGLILLVSIIGGRGKVSSPIMIISGTVFSGIISNILMVIQYWIIANDPTDSRIQDLRDLMMGNFTRMTSLPMVAAMGVPILICLILLYICRGKLNIMSFGEEEAQSMGLNVRRYRNLMILIGTVLTAMVVAFCGRIGFVGFLVPLVLRRAVGPDLRKLLPAAITGGAVFLTIIYDIACMCDLQGNLSVITGPLGCIVMVFTLFRKGGTRDEAGKGAAAPGMGIR